MSNKPASSVLADFLKAQKEQYLKAVEEGKGKEWLVVMGNEAGGMLVALFCRVTTIC